MAETKKPEKPTKKSLPLTKKDKPNVGGEKSKPASTTVQLAKPTQKNTEEKEEHVFVTLKPKKSIVTEDSKETRKYAWLAYILFFIPLCINRKSEFVRHNANEGLEINIFDLLGLVLLLVGTLVKTDDVTGTSLLIICSVVGVCLLALTTFTKIYMIAISAQGKKMSTPWMWNLRIIK